jgi:large subunit ribosomal protein L32
MALPKGKISKARRNSRKANWKVSTPSIVECPNCHEMKKPHIACKKCGHYKGKEVINMKKEQKDGNA